MNTKKWPVMVTCPYCKEPAYPLQGKLGETAPGRVRFGCDNAHYFVYPAPFGYETVFLRREVA